MLSLRRAALAILTFVIVAGLAAAVLWGFSAGRDELATEAQRETAIKPPVRISRVAGEPVVTLDEVIVRQSGLQIRNLKLGPIADQLRAYAVVIDLQPLIELRNNYTIARAQQESAKAKLVASRAEFDRENTLSKTQISVSLERFQAAEATYHDDEAALATTTARAQALSETAEYAWGPVLGSLTSDASRFGRFIRHEDNLLQVTLPPDVMIDQPPMEATVQLDGARAEKIHYVSLATKTDPSIQGLSFLYSAEALEQLIPGMRLPVLLPSEKREGIVVPPEAVVWWQGRAWIYVQSSSYGFVRRAILAEHQLRDGTYFELGLPDGLKVVVRGAQMLLSEEFRGQVQVGEEGSGK